MKIPRIKDILINLMNTHRLVRFLEITTKQNIKSTGVVL